MHRLLHGSVIMACSCEDTLRADLVLHAVFTRSTLKPLCGSAEGICFLGALRGGVCFAAIAAACCASGGRLAAQLCSVRLCSDRRVYAGTCPTSYIHDDLFGPSALALAFAQMWMQTGLSASCDIPSSHPSLAVRNGGSHVTAGIQSCPPPLDRPGDSVRGTAHSPAVLGVPNTEIVPSIRGVIL